MGPLLLLLPHDDDDVEECLLSDADDPLPYLLVSCLYSRKIHCNDSDRIRP